MPVEIAACRSPDEVLSALGPLWHYFGRTLTPEDGRRFLPFIEPSRAFVAREDGAVVGGCASFPLDMTVPGGRSVPTAGLTVVGVLPTHRRRGILRGLMRVQLDDVRRRGEPLAALWASEDTIYGRFGYGLASVTGDIDVLRSASAFAVPFQSRGEFRILGEAEALEPMAEAYERVRLDYPGMLARSPDWWRHRRLADPESRRQGSGELNRLVVTHEGRPSGFALYRVNQGVTSGYVSVIEAVGATPEATRDLWRFLFDIDWVERIKANLLPMDHPLFFLLARPREMNFRVHDGVWVRLMDVPAALAARRLSDGEAVVIDVTDAFCPWNAGRWRLSGSGAERTTEEPGLTCDVTALGSVYLGGFTFARLAHAGRVAEQRPGMAARTDALFRSDRAPWCPEIF
jgi:predicted acetyltransferase